MCLSVLDMALEDTFASHAQAKSEAASAPIGKSSDPAVRESAQEPKTKVFISYSRKDIAFADRLDAALWARGFEPLIDRTDIYAFEHGAQRGYASSSPMSGTFPPSRAAALL